jgi:hypothetical protein
LVIRVVLTLASPLPVYPANGTSPAGLFRARSGQERKNR